MHLVLHALAVKKHADADTIAEFLNLPRGEVSRLLIAAASGSRVVEAQGKYILAPLARVALEAQYSREYSGPRGDPAFTAAYEAFERLNVLLKTLITDWQVIEIAGSRIPNDHSDAEYDARIVDRLGDLHDRADRVLSQLARGVPRLTYYQKNLTIALEKADNGQSEWVSDARLPSYHTLWFELHEDLLRIVGRKRSE